MGRPNSPFHIRTPSPSSRHHYSPSRASLSEPTASSSWPLLPLSSSDFPPRPSSPSSPSSPTSPNSYKRPRLYRARLALIAVVSATLIGLAMVSLRRLYPLFFYDRQGQKALIFAEPHHGEGVDVEHWVEPFGKTRRAATGGDSDDKLAPGQVQWNPLTVQTELDRRLLTLSLPPTPLTCEAPTPSVVKRYQALSSTLTGRVFIALNLHSSEAVLPTLASTILALIPALGGPSKLFVSVYENGSWDQTPTGLAHFAAALTALGVPHAIMSDAVETDWSKVNRIAQLAEYRNLALAPLDDAAAAGGEFTDVMFINDVYLCPTDVFELLYQRRAQGASAACGTDWRETNSYLDQYGMRAQPDVLLYDNWVARSLSGHSLRPRVDVLAEWRDGWGEIFELEDSPQGEEWRQRWSEGLPVPVYSCWNGVVAFSAAPFRGLSAAATSGSSHLTNTTTVTSHTTSNNTTSATNTTTSSNLLHAPPVKFRHVPPAEMDNECPASECKLIAKDLWSRQERKFLMVPRVAVTYEHSVYRHPTLQKGARRGKDFPEWGDEKVHWEEVEEPTEVVCWPWHKGTSIDFWWNRVMESPWDAMKDQRRLKRRSVPSNPSSPLLRR